MKSNANVDTLQSMFCAAVLTVIRQPVLLRECITWLQDGVVTGGMWLIVVVGGGDGGGNIDGDGGRGIVVAGVVVVAAVIVVVVVFI